MKREGESSKRRKMPSVWTHPIHCITRGGGGRGAVRLLGAGINIDYCVIGIWDIEQCLHLDREEDLQIMGAVKEMFFFHISLIQKNTRR